MKNAGLVVLTALAALILMLAGPVMAAPMPQQMIVNNDSMQCARFMPGDECARRLGYIGSIYILPRGLYIGYCKRDLQGNRARELLLRESYGCIR